MAQRERERDHLPIEDNYICPTTMLPPCFVDRFTFTYEFVVMSKSDLSLSLSIISVFLIFLNFSIARHRLPRKLLMARDMYIRPECTTTTMPTVVLCISGFPATECSLLASFSTSHLCQLTGLVLLSRS